MVHALGVDLLRSCTTCLRSGVCSQQLLNGKLVEQRVSVQGPGSKFGLPARMTTGRRVQHPGERPSLRSRSAGLTDAKETSCIPAAFFQVEGRLDGRCPGCGPQV